VGDVSSIFSRTAVVSVTGGEHRGDGWVNDTRVRPDSHLPDSGHAYQRAAVEILVVVPFSMCKRVFMGKPELPIRQIQKRRVQKLKVCHKILNMYLVIIIGK